MTALPDGIPEFASGAHHIPEVDAHDWYAGDDHLQWLARRSVGEGLWPLAESALRDAGTLVPTKIEPLMPVIEANPPMLRQYDHRGQRIDEVDYHPYFKEIEKTEHAFGLVRMGFIPGWRGLPGRAPAGLHGAVEYFFLQADQSRAIQIFTIFGHLLPMMGPRLAARFGRARQQTVTIPHPQSRSPEESG